MKSIILVSAIAVGLVLQGCGSVVLPTVAALNAVSPLEADPADFEVAATLPEGADIPANSAIFNISMSRADTGEDIKQDFSLQRRETTDGRILFRIHPDDWTTFRDLQATARTWEIENTDDASGSFGITVTPCQSSDALDLDDTFSVAIRTAQDGPFLPLLRNVPIRDALAEVAAADTVQETAYCD